MPSRGTYHITSREEGKAVQRDQSYRSCLLALVIFFFLCLVLILACLPWKRYHTFTEEHRNKHAGTAQHHYGEHERKTTTSTTESIRFIEKQEPIEPEEPLNNATTLEQSEELEATSTTVSAFEGFERFNATNDTDSSLTFQKLVSTEESVKEEILTTSMINTESTTISESILTEYTSSSYEDIPSTTEPYTTENINNTDSYSTQYVTTELSTVIEKDVTENYKTTTEEYSNRTVTEITESTTAELTSTDSTTYTAPRNYTTRRSVTPETFEVTESSLNEPVCLTAACKQIASKMLFYMNHSMDPCEDFYEYACGGFEANPQVVEQDLENIAYQRIAKQMAKEDHLQKSSLFSQYYNSCMQYENKNYTERIQMARQVLEGIGNFYTATDWTENRKSFTELIAKLLLHHSALLFDVSPVLDEYWPMQYTFKIGPKAYKNPFDTDKIEDSCYASEFEREQERVDLGQLYKEYKTCKDDTEETMKSISEALTELGVFNKLNNTPTISQYIRMTVMTINSEIKQKFLANYPPKNKIREAYLMNNYSYVTVKELMENCKIVNWTQLIHLLTNEFVKPEIHVQVYFYDALIQGLRSLEEFRARDDMQLNNAVLGLYAHYLYHELVLSKHSDLKGHCLRVASNLLIPDASSLYISSFSSTEVNYMSKSIENTFDQLKETLMLEIRKAEWTTDTGRKILLGKISDLQVAVPNISYFTDDNSAYRKTEIHLTNNFFDNSVKLLQRYRTLMYKESFRNQGAEQIWTHYATPFQSKGLAIYGLNLVVIPFGAIDWSIMYDNSLSHSFDYLLLATLGNVIARQIAHHFDAIGIYYWNGTNIAKISSLDKNDLMYSNIENYIDCQKNTLYESSMNMFLPSTGQTVSYKISQLTLNERLSEIMGLRLAYDTLNRLRSNEEIHLPWLQLSVNQSFYVAYTQMHCTKLALTSSYISLYEDEQLPSRIRIFVAASNNKFLGEAWNCPDGSQIVPSYTCNVFPYLESDDMKGITMM